MAIKRVKTLIKGFDELIEGGFPQGSITLLTGAPGTGKTLFSLELLCNGAEKFNEKGLFISFEQSPRDLKSQGDGLGLGVSSLVKKGKIKLMYVDLAKQKDLVELITSEIKKGKYKRLVLDSLSTIVAYPVSLTELKEAHGITQIADSLIPIPLDTSFITRVRIKQLVDEIKKLSCTSILISELSEDSSWLSRDTVSEFLVDGVVVLNYMGIGGSDYRTLQVRKIRWTNQKKGHIPFEIEKGGLVVKPEEASSVLLK